MRALITGGNGFVAQWAMRAMQARGWHVTAAGRGPQRPTTVLTPGEQSQIVWVPMDITSQADVRVAVEAARPDVVLHLAAMSHVPDATADPARAYDTNVVGLVRVLAEIRRARDTEGTNATLLVVGSSEQYGRGDGAGTPLCEAWEQRPLSLYASSKVAAEVAALQAARTDGVRVICTRSFSHSGPGHGARFLLPSLVARALALPPRGGRLRVGNPDTVRDFLHVADVVDAYLALLSHGVSGEVYNVCSGVGIRVADLAAAVLARVGVAADLERDPGLARAVDVPTQIGNPRKLRTATSWVPARSVEGLVDDLIRALARERLLGGGTRGMMAAR